VDVDHEDTQAQGRQIASSEFFRNLQSQARRLREARKPAPESAVKVSANADE
jgi:hypothetical protein